LSYVRRSRGTRRCVRSLASPALWAATFVFIAAPSVRAWSFNVHRFIADRAIDELAAEIRPFFQKYRVQFVEHAIDPDLWRNAGFEEEPPRHFLDLDAYGPYPFDALPHDYEAAVSKFGTAMVTKNGLLPWRTGEIYRKLVGAFADQKNGRAYALDNIKFFASILAHYISDAHVPFHAIVNYDGQQTGQYGIHARYETELFERYQDKLTIQPPKPIVGRNARDLSFSILAESAQMTAAILAADREAIGSGEVYDSAYYDRFFALTRPTLERRISDSIGVVAVVIKNAWEDGGRPELPLSTRPRDTRKRQTR
jgi:Zinc dependent phospholipase C